MLTAAELYVRANTTELKKGAVDLDKFSAKAKKTEAAVENMSNEMFKASSGAKKIAPGLTASGNAAKVYGRQMQSSTFHTANLTAQLNDIGVMLAAGQNPLQLAMQQGTQVNQVFAQMGGHRQAIRGLGTAFLSMINPMSLATLGIIAGGAALTQWGMSALGAGKDSESLEDKMSDLTGGIQKYKDTLDLANPNSEELANRFGEAAEKAASLFAELSRINGLNLRQFGSDLTDGLALGEGDVKDLFGLNSIRRADRRAAAGQSGLGDTVREAEGLDAQVAAVEALLANTKLLAELRGGITDREAEYIGLLSQRLSKMLEIQSATDVEAQNAAKAAAIGNEYYQSRLAIQNALRDEMKAQEESLAQSYALMGQSRAESEASLTAAQETVAELQAQADTAALIAKFGEGSLTVALDRVSTERELYQKSLDTLDVSDQMKTALLGAWDAANGVASVDMAGNISLAANEAVRLNKALAASMGLSGGVGGPDQAVQAMRDEFGGNGKSGVVFSRTYRAANRNSRGGGGKSEAQREAERLLKEQERIAKGIFDSTRTAAEKYKKEINEINDVYEQGLINADTYARAVQQVQDEYSGLADINKELKSAIIDMAADGEDAFDSLKESIKRAAIEYALFGTGTFAGAGGGGSGLLGGLLGGASLFGGGSLLSFDGGGRTPSGPRSGGVDGKGGFFAINHPNETIIDHTKGGGAPVTEIIVRSEPGTVVEIARGEAVKVTQAGIAQNNRNFEKRQGRPRFA